MRYLFRKFISESDVLKYFDCGIPDLNSFLLQRNSDTPNATFFEKEHLACTYIAIDEETTEIAGYFSLLHDKIERQVADNAVWNHLSRMIPNSKRRSSYPALKVGRLAVGKRFQNSGLGRKMLSFIQAWFFRNPKAGCRFITVDALVSAESFYRSCDFKVLRKPEDGDDTVLMYFDLKGLL